MKKNSINKTEPEMTQMIELVHKALKQSRRQRNIGKSPNPISRDKHTSESITLNTAKEKISEFKHVAI